MRTSRNGYNKQGRLIYGYDYERQAWVIDGRYVNCGHPEGVDCGCYGRRHQGEETEIEIEEETEEVSSV